MSPVTFVTTTADKWWQAQIQPIRALRGKDWRTQQQGIQELLDMGLIPTDQISNYLRVFKYGWAPDFVWTVEQIAQMPRAADLVIPLPFTPQWPNRKGDPPPIGDCWYEQPQDTSPVGSLSETNDPTGPVYEKFQCNASVSMNPIYYADWSLDFGDRTLRCWVRTK